MQTKLNTAEEAFQYWRKTELKERIEKLIELKTVLIKHRQQCAVLITEEMRKPISQSLAEIDKCAWLCDYYAENSATFLTNTFIQTDAEESYITYEPLGVLLGVMPWNFPFWQVFRFAIPAIISGNTVVIKHASNVPQTAETIESLFIECGFPVGVYQNLHIESSKVAEIIANPIVKAVSLTGSEQAGQAVASQAGKYLKKSILELGGSNAFIVCEDAEIEKTVAIAVNARMQNAGQSCIAAKRFLVQKNIYEKFTEEFTKAINKLIQGDPMNPETQIGPLARIDLAIELENQVTTSEKMGAKKVIGGKRNGSFYEPTVLTDVTPEMPVFKQETFGPVAAIIPFENFEQAIALSNQSEFGLGVSIFTKNIEKIRPFLSDFNEGAVFINELVKSDPRLPFGGVKKSGYGRELAEEGLKAFVNIKTVFIKNL